MDMDVVASHLTLNPVVDIASMTEAEIKWSQRVRTRRGGPHLLFPYFTCTLMLLLSVMHARHCAQLQLAVSDLVEFLSEQCQTTGLSFKRTASNKVDFATDDDEAECNIHPFEFIEDPQYDKSLKDLVKCMSFPISIYVHVANQVMKREEAVRSQEEFNSLVDILKAKAVSVWEAVPDGRQHSSANGPPKVFDPKVKDLGRLR